MDSITATPAHQTIQELPLTANQSQNQPTIQEYSHTDNFIPKAHNQEDYSSQTANINRVITKNEDIVNKLTTNWFYIRDHHNQHLNANTSLPIETNINLQIGVIDALSIIYRNEAIPICNMTELGPFISELIDKENGRLFVVTTSQGLYSKNTSEIYSIKEVEALKEKVYQLIEDNTASVSMKGYKMISYYKSYSSIIYNCDIEKQKQKADNFIKKAQQQNNSNLKITLSYDTTQEIPNDEPFQKENIGHALGLDIRLKNNKITVLCYHSCASLNALGFNGIDSISETLHNIHNQTKDKNISSVFVNIPLGTEENGTDCTLHSFHFAKTSKDYAEKIEELHEGLATKNQDSIISFLTDKFPQEFFTIAQKEQNVTYLTQQIFKDNKNERVSEVIQTNTRDNFLFSFHKPDTKTFDFFNNFADITQDIMTAKEHKELTEFAYSLNDKKLTQGNYPFFTTKVNTTLNIELQIIIDSIQDFIASPDIFLLPSEDLSKLLSITQKISETIHKNDLPEYPKILEQAIKLYNLSNKNLAEYAYKKATSLISSEEFPQIADIIPSKNSIKQTRQYSDTPLDEILRLLESESRSNLPQKLDLLHEKITSREIIEDHNKIFDAELVKLVNNILAFLGNIKSYTADYNDSRKKQGLPIEDKVIINIGNKCFCLKEKQELIEKMHSLVYQLHFLISYSLTKIHENKEDTNNKMLAYSWEKIIGYKHST